MVRALGEVLGPDDRVLVIDDNSPDGTGELADRLAAELEYVDVLHRARKEGLGPAYLAGFRRALERGAELVARDGLRLLARPRRRAAPDRAAAGDADLVLGSRYVPGGGVARLGRSCAAPSPPAARSTRGCCSASRSATSPAGSSASGARCSRRSTSTRSTPRATPSRSRRPTARCARGFRVVEVPISFVDREVGGSKMSRRDRARGDLEGAARSGSRRCGGSAVREVTDATFEDEVARRRGPSSSTSGRRGASRARRSSRPRGARRRAPASGSCG